VLTLILLPFVNQAYLRVQLGNIALGDTRYNEAIEHFTAAVNASAFFYKLPIHLIYEEFVVVRWFDVQPKNPFVLNCVFSAAFRLGPQVLVANREPATVSCSLSGR
jgi:hypothetical protein